MQPTYCTTEELAAQIAPFIGRKFVRGPRIAAIDILGPSERFDADVRGISTAGVEMFWINDCDTAPWDRIRGIRIAAIGADGYREYVREYLHIGLARELAA